VERVPKGRAGDPAADHQRRTGGDVKDMVKTVKPKKRGS
jgi:hypothetical protein